MRMTKRLKMLIPGTDIEVSAKTFAEMNTGQLANKRYEQIIKVDEAIVMLTKRFEALWLSSTMPPPYDHVKVSACRREDKLASTEFWEPVEGFPSDHFITQLMLMS